MLLTFGLHPAVDNYSHCRSEKIIWIQIMVSISVSYMKTILQNQVTVSAGKITSFWTRPHLRPCLFTDVVYRRDVFFFGWRMWPLPRCIALKPIRSLKWYNYQVRGWGTTPPFSQSLSLPTYYSGSTTGQFVREAQCLSSLLGYLAPLLLLNGR